MTNRQASIAEQSASARINAILQDRWIGFPLAENGLARMRALIHCPRKTRMPGLLICGDSGMGKTMLAQKLLRMHPPQFDRSRGIERRPVCFIQTPPSPDEKRFYAHLLDELGVPTAPRATVSHLESMTLQILRDLDVKVLVLDEVHNMLAGYYQEQRRFLNVLRFLSNELQVCLVCIGIAEARNAIRGDIQLARRFGEHQLPKWSAGSDFEALITNIIASLDLKKKSALTAKSFRHILEQTGGVTALIFNMFQDLGIEAIMTGAEAISPENVLQWQADRAPAHNYRYVDLDDVRAALA